MNRTDNTVHDVDPWRAPVAVAQIPETGLHRDIEASPAQRKALADVAGLREVLSAHASFDLAPKSGGRVHVAGQVHARVGQTCVVTLDPIENEIFEEIDVVFAPSEETPEIPDVVEDIEEEDEELEIPDPPEAIVNGFIDLGRVATDALFLGLDPYPRKAGAVFEPRVVAADPEDHPFAALKNLRIGPSRKKSNDEQDE